MQFALERFRGRAARLAERRSALGTADPTQDVLDELAAHEAFQARAAGERGQLLVERAEQRLDRHYETILKTPTTFPSTWTYGGYMGSRASFSG